MSEVRIPQHVAERIERRWAEKIEQERARKRSAQSIGFVHDRKSRSIPVLRQQSVIGRH